MVYVNCLPTLLPSLNEPLASPSKSEKVNLETRKKYYKAEDEQQTSNENSHYRHVRQVARARGRNVNTDRRNLPALSGFVNDNDRFPTVA